jgi:sugar phosphate isomerase/epimerase
MPTDDAYAALVSALEPVTAYAATKGVPLAIENNSTATRGNGFIHTLLDAAELSQDTGIGIVLELQNCWMERHLARLFREHVKRFALVQVSDFLVGEAAKLNRRVPGDGSMPIEWMLERLLDAGYGGLFEIEVLGPAIEEEGYASAISRSLDWLSERLHTWGV